MEDQIQEQAIATEDNAELSFWGNFVNIFANPAKTFASLDKRPTWLIPMMMLILATVIITQIAFPILMESQMENFRNNPNIAPEQLQVIEQQMSENVIRTQIITAVSQVIFTFLIFYLLLSFVFYFAGSVILGGDATFKKVLSVFSWSSCILLLASIVGFPLILVKESMQVSISPALLLADDSVGTTLHTLLSKFDFFTIWFLAVFASGFAAIYKFSTAKAYITIGVFWGIWIALSTTLADVFSRFGM